MFTGFVRLGVTVSEAERTILMSMSIYSPELFLLIIMLWFDMLTRFAPSDAMCAIIGFSEH